MFCTLAVVMFLNMTYVTSSIQVKFVSHARHPVLIKVNSERFVIGVPSRPSVELSLEEEEQLSVDAKILRDPNDLKECDAHLPRSAFDHFRRNSLRFSKWVNYFSIYNFEKFIDRRCKRGFNFSEIPTKLKGYRPSQRLLVSIDDHKLEYSFCRISKRGAKSSCVVQPRTSNPWLIKYTDPDGDLNYVRIETQPNLGHVIHFDQNQNEFSVKEIKTPSQSHEYRIGCSLRAAIFLALGLNDPLFLGRVKSMLIACIDIIGAIVSSKEKEAKYYPSHGSKIIFNG